MVYGMTGRQHPSAPAMWRFWDEFGIREAEWLGYWSPKCPVQTDQPGVLATAYRKPGKTLIALAHWPNERLRPQAVTQAVATAPAIDGQLAPGEWDAAARLTGLRDLSADTPTANQTEVFITHDETRLLLAFRCHGPSGALKTAATVRDGAVWEDDAVEIFLQPDPARDTYFQFVGNSAGVFFDSRGLGGQAWNGDWTYKTAIESGVWTGEISIPFAALGMKPPADGTTLGFNICRDQQTPAKRLSCWAPVTGSFHDPKNFGRLRFAATEPPTRQELGRTETDIPVRLKIDWKALGLDGRKAKLTAPRLEHFQAAAEFAPSAAIPVPPSQGWLLVAAER
jgi:hypothetical protein